MKSSIQCLKRRSYWNYINSIIESDENSDRPSTQKRFWHYVKSLKKDASGVSPLKVNGHLYSDNKDKANILNQQYQSVFTKENPTEIPSPSGKRFPSMPEISVSCPGVEKLLRQLNPNKAPGPDSIPARVLKECSNELAPLITILFNKSLLEGKIPEDWKEANITAVFKKGDRNLPSNYRPVSLTCLLCKLQEHILVSNIMSHLDKHNVLTDSQHGFRARRSCETQLVSLVHELASSLDSGIQTDLAILDFSKAFDKVPHKRLLKKLDHYGVRGNTYFWVKDFLSDRKQQVIVDGAISDPGPVTSGVPQGTVLGPLLFLIFINDLPDQLNCKVRLFADDCIVYSKIHSEQDQHNLQSDLETLANWENTWGMEFHPQKCSIMSITRSKSPRLYNYKLKGHTLENTKSAKYLGVTLTSDLSWNTHIDTISKKANSVLGFLKRNLKNCSTETKSKAYKALVRPHLEYCSTVWNPFSQDNIYKLEIVQRRAARYALNRYHNTSSVTSMLEDLKWDTLDSRRAKTQVLLLYKIVNNIVDIDANQFLTPGSTRTRANHTKKFRQFSCKHNTFKYSFFPRSVVMWNSLPKDLAEAPDLVSFRRGLNSCQM